VLVVVEVVMATEVDVVVNVCTVVCNDYKKCQNCCTQISANTFCTERGDAGKFVYQ
jgi:hypothetical protein